MLTTSILDSRRTRLKLLYARVAELETAAKMAAPIRVEHIRECSHTECGKRMPRIAPGTDCLIIRMGCIHESPTQHTSEDE